MNWFSVLGLVVLVVFALVLFTPAVSASGWYVYSGNVYRTPNYIGSYVVSQPVALYSYNAFVQPIRPVSFTPYYTSYSIPVYSGNRYFVVPRFRHFRDLDIDIDIEFDD